MSRRPLVVVAGLLVAGLVLLSTLTGFLVDWLWFESLGFYVFTLPVYRLTLDWGFVIVVLCALTAGGIFWARGAIELGEGVPQLAAPARRHGSALLGLFLLLKAGSYLLQRYDLLLDSTGVVVGAGYTDLHLRLPFLTVLAGLGLVGTALCAANLRVGGLRPPGLAVVLLLAGSVSETAIAALVQSYRVKPDELRLEAPYLARGIAGTRYGFALDRLTVKTC